MHSIPFTALACSLGLSLLSHAAEIPNPAINYDEFSELTRKLDPIRKQNRITEDEHIQMATEPNTIILDARSKDRYDRIHVKGAIHLAFTDFTADALAAKIPDKATRILIYCNNNFDNNPVDFARKTASVSLNVPTFINLHAYGYTNGYGHNARGWYGYPNTDAGNRQTGRGPGTHLHPHQWGRAEMLGLEPIWPTGERQPK